MGELNEEIVEYTLHEFIFGKTRLCTCQPMKLTETDYNQSSDIEVTREREREKEGEVRGKQEVFVSS